MKRSIFDAGSNRGFTLVELMVVVGIIAVLAGLLLPVVTAARHRSQIGQVESLLGSLDNAFRIYRLQELDWPNPQDETWTPIVVKDMLSVSLDDDERGLLEWLEIVSDFAIPYDYLKPVAGVTDWRTLTDPWGQPYIYQLVDPLDTLTAPGQILFWKERVPGAFGPMGDEPAGIIYSAGDGRYQPTQGDDLDGAGYWSDPDSLIYRKTTR